ncbi:anti-phage ZorAB system protein ZorA [Labrys monachus]|uniref:ABC-type transporter Mla subunit MlaD n=1 Tax=Labrys monachus TaxID=217067 RepID=A0ABU0FNF1_9HYPH|nr:anti-phage ZorAB system protein ZorA [Labrys monachus]MDQ0395550.1 ABC-type transporter Mla subunit MlaD [Labrys monachus]
MREFLSAAIRFVLFWSVTAATVFSAEFIFSFINFKIVYGRFLDAVSGNVDEISRPEFAYSLAGIIFSSGVGLAVSFLLFHVAPVIFVLSRARNLVRAAVGNGRNDKEVRRAFASGFERLRQRLSRQWLIGHSWIEFEETLVDTDSTDAIGNTVRPQVFFNISVARERLAGLKMMNAVPGYFVGIGLLLTFIGLVLALHKAGAAAAAGDSTVMAKEMGELLQIATFKFSTSIAGLGASIILSIVFRWFFVLIESAFYRFNAALERGLLYHAPQSIAIEMSRTMQDQLVQLKDITQGDFFARMGSEIAPHLNAAISDAMTPITDQIGSAVGSLTTNSQSGVESMARSFAESLQHGAGAEMRELAATLKQLQMSMVEMQTGVRGSGDQFAAKLSEAADNLNRMVERAGQSFETSSTQSRDSLAAVVETLRQTMERANADLDTALGAAAGGASAKLESAMGNVMGKLDEQIIGVGARFGELARSMQAIEGALASQRVALEGASAEARNTAQAFAESAGSVRTATAPLMNVGDKFSSASEKLAASVGATLETLNGAKDQMATLAKDLQATNTTTNDFWRDFSSKFDDVDTALAKAVKALSESTSDQEQRLRDHVRQVDQGLTEAIQKMSPMLASISDSAESIADSLEKNRPMEEAE